MLEFLYSLIKLIVAGTAALLFFGLSPLFNTSIFPAIPMLLGVGTLSARGRLPGFFLGFMFSFAISQIAVGFVMHVLKVDYSIQQKIGLLFLIAFGFMMLFPQYAIWDRFKDDYRKAKYYGIFFGFIWSFWTAVPTSEFYSETNIFVIIMLVYFMLVSTSVPALLFAFIAFVLSKLYGEKHLPFIKKGIGWLTLLISLTLFFGYQQDTFKA